MGPSVSLCYLWLSMTTLLSLKCVQYLQRCIIPAIVFNVYLENGYIIFHVVNLVMQCFTKKHTNAGQRMYSSTELQELQDSRTTPLPKPVEWSTHGATTAACACCSLEKEAWQEENIKCVRRAKKLPLLSILQKASWMNFVHTYILSLCVQFST